MWQGERYTRDIREGVLETSRGRLTVLIQAPKLKRRWAYISVLLTLTGISLVVLLFVLIPFYMTFGNVPSMQPGWFPTEPYEFESIARFRGTPWENSAFLQEAFWRIGCAGWLVWFPVAIVAITQMRRHRLLYAEPARKVIIISSILFVCLWLFASATLLAFGD